MSVAKDSVFVESVGLFGTGFRDWHGAGSILRGETSYVETSEAAPAPKWLPPAERRRTSDIIRLALEAGRDCLESVNADLTESNTVFSSSGGSGEVIHQICESLAMPEREVSPTRFHNSVHNAPAGYWGIATRNQWPSTSLCAHDASFSAGFLEAFAQALQCERSVLLMVHDLAYPEPLNAVRPVFGQFSMALLLRSKQSAASRVRISACLQGAASQSQQTSLSEWPHLDGRLERFRLSNPAARCLPLLVCLARLEARSLRFKHTGDVDLEISLSAVEPL